LPQAPAGGGGAGPNFGLVGDSPEIRRVLHIICKLRNNRCPVLLEGESGTGKELAARALHTVSPGPAGVFVAVNAAALPATLIESELFGHAPGSYTGALRARQGLIEQAHGGTLFLDEIGELPLALQSKLLRVVEEKQVRPLGSNRPAPADPRIIAATNRDLRREVEGGRFRADLYYRLNVIRIRLPALRERRDDIPLLVRHFLAKYARPETRVSPRLMDRLSAYEWPGNVRELENTVQRMAALTSRDELDIEDLPTQLRTAVDGCRRDQRPRLVYSLREVEWQAIEDALRLAGGNRRKAARLLGIGVTTLYRKLKESGGTGVVS
jgi:DNA-binding NtrC family response regulator